MRGNELFNSENNCKLMICETEFQIRRTIWDNDLLLSLLLKMSFQFIGWFFICFKIIMLNIIMFNFKNLYVYSLLHVYITKIFRSILVTNNNLYNDDNSVRIFSENNLEYTTSNEQFTTLQKWQGHIHDHSNSSIKCHSNCGWN